MRVERALVESGTISATDLFTLAADAYGGTLAEGAFTPRDAYDAAELGLHLRADPPSALLCAQPACTCAQACPGLCPPHAPLAQ